MATTATEAPKEAKAPDNAKSAEGKAEAPAAPGGKGIKAWLPLIVAVVTMPALAFATTHFILLPKIERAMNGGKPAAAPGTPEAERFDALATLIEAYEARAWAIEAL